MFRWTNNGKTIFTNGVYIKRENETGKFPADKSVIDDSPGSKNGDRRLTEYLLLRKKRFKAKERMRIRDLFASDTSD